MGGCKMYIGGEGFFFSSLSMPYIGSKKQRAGGRRDRSATAPPKSKIFLPQTNLSARTQHRATLADRRATLISNGNFKIQLPVLSEYLYSRDT